MPTTGRLRIAFAVIVLAALGAGVPAPHAQAQGAAAPTVYTIELVVFRNMSGSGGPEDWSAKSIARGPESPEQPVVTGRFVQSIPASQFQLNDLAAKLQNTSNYQPIAHFAWQQTASTWGSRAGFTVAKLAGQVPGLSGIIYLERGTYLHLGMSLNYQTSNPPAALAAAPGTVFNLTESHRVRFRTLSYYDHPAYGVIALVTPGNASTGGR
ncbi:MAG: CsiV family protein [Pseudomonadota bacterium]